MNENLRPSHMKRFRGSLVTLIVALGIIILLLLAFNPDKWRDFLLDIAASFVIQAVLALLLFSLLFLLALVVLRKLLLLFFDLRARLFIFFLSAVLALLPLPIFFHRRLDEFDVIQTMVMLVLFFLLSKPLTRLLWKLELRVPLQSATTFSEQEDNPAYKTLLAICGGDCEMANRLIAYEHDRKPRGTPEEWIRNAVERWRRDNR